MENSSKLKMALIFITGIALIVVFAWKRISTNVQPDQSGTLSTQRDRQEIEGCLSANEVSPAESSTIPTGNQDDAPSQDSLLSKKEKTPLATEYDALDINLPEPFTETELELAIAQFEAKQIWKAQEKVMSTWPAYSEVQEHLHKELSDKLNPGELSEEELIQAALEFRDNFWNAGRDLSKNSYRHIYKARILLELAHSKKPENLTITDELVETIQSAQLTWKYETNSNEKIINNQLIKVLTELRSAQFEQIKQEVKQKRMPAWEDFVRTYDLAQLLGDSEEYESAQKVVEWMLHEAERGEWSAYAGPLRNLQQCLKKGYVSEFNIYLVESDYPSELRYARRLPSFKGPDIEERGVTPVHIRTLNPIWGSLEDL